MKSSSRGFTILEAVIGLAIAGLLFAALATFFGRGISNNRFQFEQLLTTDAGRFLFERMVSDIRLAQPGPNGEPWLAAAGDYYVYFYANIDDDAGIELIRYTLFGSELTRGITQPGESQESITVFENLRNPETQPLLAYYGSSQAPLPLNEVNSDTVLKIRVTMVIDVKEEQQPGPLSLVTFVTPRMLRNATGVTARLNQVTLNYPLDHTATLNVEVKTFFPSTGITGTGIWPITKVNDALTLYTGEKVNINYQTVTVGSYLPGWYAWVGPIVVGQSGNQQYTVTKQLTISDLCLGDDLENLLLNCPKQTVSYGTFSKQFQPIILYQQAGYQDYVRAITFTYDPDTGTPPPANPVPTLAYWKFDEGNSNVGNDSSGNGHTGTMNNGLGSSQGWTSTNKPSLNFTNRYALEFDGGNDDVDISNASDLSLINNFTFSTWIKTSESGVQMLYHSGANTAPNAGFQISLNSNGQVVMKTSADPTVASTTAINDGAWHHIAVVVQSNGQVDFYKDGVADGSYPLDNNLVYAITTYTGTRYIGENPSSSQNNFAGALDDVRLYSVALTLAQIQTLAAGNEPQL